MPKPVAYSYQATTYNLMPSLPTERVRIKWRESLMLNKFLFTTLEIFSRMEPFQTYLSECNRHRFYFPSESKYLLYLLPSLLRSLQKQFPHSTFKTVQGACVGIGVTLPYMLETSSFSAVSALSSNVPSYTTLRLRTGKVREHGKPVDVNREKGLNKSGREHEA